MRNVERSRALFSEAALSGHPEVQWTSPDGRFDIQVCRAGAVPPRLPEAPSAVEPVAVGAMRPGHRVVTGVTSP